MLHARDRRREERTVRIPIIKDYGRRRGRRKTWPFVCLVAGLALLALAVWRGRVRHAAPARAARPPAAATNAAVRVASGWRELVFPTAQNLLAGEPDVAVFQPTGSGKAESALFGSVRTVERGGRVMSAFHEGIDIAALQRDRQNRPLDGVRAIAAGTVAYVNRVAGNSSYGRYVVLDHGDPLGEVYSLYAHLAEIEAGLQPGAAVGAGDPIGRMGNSSTAGIPMDRAHLHLELALLTNARFAEWYRAQKLTPDHGNFNGRNLLGVDPLAFFKAQRANPDVGFQDFLAAMPRAFAVVVRTRGPLDYFARYPRLWHGPADEGGATFLACAENGLPLAGRRATAEECRALARGAAVVCSVNESALGRNGCHLVRRDGEGWTLGNAGWRWLEILSYPNGTGAADTRPRGSPRRR
jgi:murein DD-endopeptidase MepM/ murein hydrolase activator NlpD